MLGKRLLYGVKMTSKYKKMKDKTLLEIIDLTGEENILQTMDWDENGVPINN